MSEKKIVVPEGMLEAALDGLGIEIIKARRQYVKDTLEAALHWLSENPIVPTEKQIADLAKTMPYEDSGNGNVLAVAVVEWQRRMYLAPEPEVPEETPEIIRLLDERMERYSMWLHRAMDAVIEGESLPARLDWDKAGEKSKVYGDEAFQRNKKARK